MKTLPIIGMICGILTFSANAAFNGPTNNGSGFSGAGTNQITSIKQIKESGSYSDDMPVVLTGYIQQAVAPEKYNFTDNTGTILVEIDHDKWYGVQANPKTKVTLYGEVDWDHNMVSVDVDAVRLAK